MVQQSFDQISCFSETLFFHLSARFYGQLILTMPYNSRVEKGGAPVAQWVKCSPTDLADRVRSTLEVKSSQP